MITNTENILRDSFADGSLSGYRENTSSNYSLYPYQSSIGTKNLASGAYATAIGGQNIKAYHSGSVVIGDGNLSRLKSSTTPNSLVIDFENGTTINGYITTNSSVNIAGSIIAQGSITAGPESYIQNLSADEIYAGFMGSFSTEDISAGYIEASNINAYNQLYAPYITAQNIVDIDFGNKSLINLSDTNLTLSGERYMIIRSKYIPSSPTSSGISGAVVFDDNYLYRHNGKNWTRTAMSTW